MVTVGTFTLAVADCAAFDVNMSRLSSVAVFTSAEHRSVDFSVILDVDFSVFGIGKILVRSTGKALAAAIHIATNCLIRVVSSQRANFTTADGHQRVACMIKTLIVGFFVFKTD